MNRLKRGLVLWGPALIWMAAIFGLSSIGTNEPPDTRLLTIVIKKAGHVIEYALLAALYVRAITGGRRPLLGALTASAVLAVLYAASDEIHQTYIPGRHGQSLDVGIDLGGALLGLFLWKRWWEGRLRLPPFLLRWGLPPRGSIPQTPAQTPH